MVVLFSSVAFLAVTLSVDPDAVKAELPRTLYGTGLEDVNHEIYGGLDAQRLYGESFEEEFPCAFRWWKKVEETGGGEFGHPNDVAHWGKRSLLLDPRGGTCAVANFGLHACGVPTRADRRAVGHLFVRGKADRLEVGLQDFFGERTYATARLDADSPDGWKRIDFTLAPDATDPHGRFFVRASGEGKVWIDDVYLADEPTDEFGRLGCREDIVAALREEGINFLRWGGTMVNVPGYRLANMNGTGERKPYKGHWYEYSSGGFGPYEFVRFAAAMKLPCALSISRDETLEDALAFAEWTRRFDIPICVQIGNEECITQFGEDNIESYRRYFANVRRLVPPMRERNPKLTFASALMWEVQVGTLRMDLNEEAFRVLDGLVDFWDLHLWMPKLDGAFASLKIMRDVRDFLKRMNPQTRMKVAIFEENGKTHSLERALAHAVTMSGVRELGPDIYTCCGANALQANLRNDNNWNQGQVFFTTDRVWLQPYGYAKQMGARNHRELLVGGSSDDPEVVLSPTRARDGSSVVLHVVNVSGEPKPFTLKGLDGCRLTKATELSGAKLGLDNPVTDRTAVVPRDVTARLAEGKTLAPYSYTVLEFAR